jgi:hypothetical protein
MNVEVKILREAGYEEAMLGLSLSRNKPVEDMPAVALKLSGKDGGHNKFLESICVWLDITMPRYWWQQFDTYRLMTKQSGSTMYTILKRPLIQDDFVQPIQAGTLIKLNYLIERKAFRQIKVELPEGFLQRRIPRTDYKTLRNILQQRRTHKLEEWSFFCGAILTQIERPELIV